MHCQNPSKLLSRLRLQQLNLLCGVAKGHTFGELARHMALSQPAISKMAREMEDTIGGQLFHRERNGVRLTDLGLLLVHDAQLIVNGVMRIDENITAHQQGINAVIKIGSPSYTAVSLLSEPVARLVGQFSKLQVKMFDGIADTLYQQLKNGEIDFLIGSLPTHVSGYGQGPPLQVEELYPDEVHFLAHKSNPCVGQPVELDMLRRFPWVMPSGDSLIRRALQNAIVTAGLTLPPVPVEASVMSTLGALVVENESFITPLRSDAAYYLAAQFDLEILQMQKPILLPPVAIVHLQHTSPLPAAQTLFSLIRERVTILFKQTATV